VTMNPELKGPWVAALRSGEYDQTTEQLSRGLDEYRTGYCCLGVLCVVNGWEFDEGDGGTESGPTELIGEWSGLPGESGLTKDERETLANMNDSGKSFAVIADWIEEKL
jgi:hypothetical protein